MPTVYIVQNPQGKEIEPARKFGTFKVILTGHEHPDLAITKLAMALRAMRSDDYLLQIGTVFNIGLATHLALVFTDSSLQVLVWQPETYTYKIQYINLNGNSLKSPNTAANRGR